MNQEEMFGRLNKADRVEVFGEFDPTQHEDEARDRWGDTEAYAESSKRTARYSKDDWKRMGEESGAINQRLADLFAAGTDPESEESMDAAEQHRLHIDRWFYPCSHEMHAGLGEMYVVDPRFTKFWEDLQPGGWRPSFGTPSWPTACGRPDSETTQNLPSGRRRRLIPHPAHPPERPAQFRLRQRRSAPQAVRAPRWRSG